MPKLSVLIGTYSENNQKYLDLTLRSLEAQTFKDFETIVVSSGEYEPRLDPRFDSINLYGFHSPDRKHFPAALTWAYEQVDNESEYILLCNDDVILHKDCLQTMVDILERDGRLILNPMSNCDNGVFFMAALGFHDKEDHSELTMISDRQYRYDQILPYVDDIIERSHISGKNFILPYMVAFYCTMMTKKCWDTVGGIDPKYKTGQDDLDFCKRARPFGFVPAITESAYSFHFSGVAADLNLTPEQRQENKDYFFEKWSERL